MFFGKKNTSKNRGISNDKIVESQIFSEQWKLLGLQLWDFIVRQVEFNRYFHPNEHPQKIFWCLEKPFDWGVLKKSYFSFQSQFLRSKINFILLKFVFLLEYWIRRTNFISDIVNLIYF